MRSRIICIVRWAMLVVLGLAAHPTSPLHAQQAFVLPEGKVGIAYEVRIQTEGGVPPLKWKVLQGELPPGIELLPLGTLNGVPTVPSREPYQFTVEVSDSSQPPQNFTRRFSLVVQATPLRIVPDDKTAGAKELKIVPPEPGGAAPAIPQPQPNGATGKDSKAGGAGSASGTTGGGAQPEEEEEEACANLSDCRKDFEASAYLGLAIDTFASGETRLYLNPNAPNGPKERLVGGIDFAYRLMGEPAKIVDNRQYRWPNQLWVYGETVHGVHSTDVDCTKNPTFLTCQNALALPRVLLTKSSLPFEMRPAWKALQAFDMSSFLYTQHRATLRLVSI